MIKNIERVRKLGLSGAEKTLVKILFRVWVETKAILKIEMVEFDESLTQCCTSILLHLTLSSSLESLLC
jgi:hypothetical protein